MWNARSVVLWRRALLLVSVIGGFAVPRSLWAQATLENPPSGSSQSGIGLVSGWKCTGGTLTFTIDNGSPAQLVYGTSRLDTANVCKNPGNNGFAYLINWNLAGNGQHTIRVFDSGQQFASATFTVTTLGAEFLQGLSATTQVSNFPQPGKDVSLQWQQSAQNFVIAAVASEGGAGICSTHTTAVTNFLTGNQTIFTVANSCIGNMVDIRVATPAGNNGAFSLCSPLLNFVQGGTQFSDGSFAWKSSAGGSVCGGFLPGTTTQTTVALNAGVALNFKKSFSVFYNQVKIADFQ